MPVLTMPWDRLRANYNPKGVGLESGLDSRVGPTLNTLWGTLSRTKRIEGWKGLYKGKYQTGNVPVVINLDNS